MEIEHTEAEKKEHLDAEKKKQEFENLLHKHEKEREEARMKKKFNAEMNKDPKEMMLVIQKNFREQYDEINNSLQSPSENVKIDDLFDKLNNLKEYYVNASYSLATFDKQFYREQLEKLEKSMQEFREKNQPRKKFAFSKKTNFEKKQKLPSRRIPLKPRMLKRSKSMLLLILKVSTNAKMKPLDYHKEIWIHLSSLRI